MQFAALTLIVKLTAACNTMVTLSGCRRDARRKQLPGTEATGSICSESTHSSCPYFHGTVLEDRSVALSQGP